MPKCSYEFLFFPVSLCEKGKKKDFYNFWCTIIALQIYREIFLKKKGAITLHMFLNLKQTNIFRYSHIRNGVLTFLCCMLNGVSKRQTQIHTYIRPNLGIIKKGFAIWYLLIISIVFIYIYYVILKPRLHLPDFGHDLPKASRAMFRARNLRLPRCLILVQD